MHDLDLPRLAIYSIWGNTQEVGWVRYALDRFEVPYDLIFKERVKKGDLKGSYDLIVAAEPGRQRQAPRVRHREPRAADRVQEERAVQEPRDVRRVRRHHRRHGRSKASRSSRSSSRPAACSSRSAPRAISRPSSAWRRRWTRRERPPQFYAPGPIVDAEILKPEHPIFYGYDKKMVPVRYGERAAAERADERESVRWPPADAAADAAERADAVSRRRRPRAERPDARRQRNPQPRRRSSTSRRAKGA